MESLEELKQQWLSGFPNSSHSLDTKRFIRYSIELAKADGSLDFNEMRERGINEDLVEDYQRKYEFLRDVLDVLGVQ